MAGRGAGLTQAHRLSPELSAIVGVKEVSLFWIFHLNPVAFLNNLQIFISLYVKF
jgi:hypothetical protein